MPIKKREIKSPALRRYVHLVGDVSTGATLTNF